MSDLIPTSPVPSSLPTQPPPPSSPEPQKAGWLDGLKSVKWSAILIEDDALSLGRVMGWVVFAGLLYLWMVDYKEPPMSMVETFWALLVYNANKKVVGPLTTFFSGRRGGPGLASPGGAASPAWSAVQEVQSSPPPPAPGATVLKRASIPAGPPPGQPAEGVKVTVISDED